MLTIESKLSAAGSFPSRPLPLESGEFMRARDFLRRCEYLPQVEKTELIAGVARLGSPLTVRHAKADALIQAWLGTYARQHPETAALTNTTVILEACAPFRCQKVGGTRFSASRRKPPASGVRSPYSRAVPAFGLQPPAFRLTPFWKRER